MAWTAEDVRRLRSGAQTEENIATGWTAEKVAQFRRQQQATPVLPPVAPLRQDATAQQVTQSPRSASPIIVDNIALPKLDRAAVAAQIGGMIKPVAVTTAPAIDPSQPWERALAVPEAEKPGWQRAFNEAAWNTLFFGAAQPEYVPQGTAEKIALFLGGLYGMVPSLAVGGAASSAAANRLAPAATQAVRRMLGPKLGMRISQEMVKKALTSGLLWGGREAIAGGVQGGIKGAATGAAKGFTTGAAVSGLKPVASAALGRVMPEIPAKILGAGATGAGVFGGRAKLEGKPWEEVKKEALGGFTIFAAMEALQIVGKKLAPKPPVQERLGEYEKMMRARYAAAGARIPGARTADDVRDILSVYDSMIKDANASMGAIKQNYGLKNAEAKRAYEILRTLHARIVVERDAYLAWAEVNIPGMATPGPTGQQSAQAPAEQASPFAPALLPAVQQTPVTQVQAQAGTLQPPTATQAQIPVKAEVETPAAGKSVSSVEQPSTPALKSGAKVALPEGWTIVIGKTRTKEGHTYEAEVDWREKRIVFADQKYMDDPKIFNHEVAHVIIETLPDKAEKDLLNKYINIKKLDEWTVKNKFHHELIVVDYGEYLTDPASISPELRRLFQNLDPALQAQKTVQAVPDPATVAETQPEAALTIIPETFEPGQSFHMKDGSTVTVTKVSRIDQERSTITYKSSDGGRRTINAATFRGMLENNMAPSGKKQIIPGVPDTFVAGQKFTLKNGDTITITKVTPGTEKERGRVAYVYGNGKEGSTLISNMRQLLMAQTAAAGKAEKPATVNTGGLSKNEARLAKGIGTGALDADDIEFSRGRTHGFDYKQKLFIADELLSEYDRKSGEPIKVEVPRDGRLTIVNDPRAIATVIDRLGGKPAARDELPAPVVRLLKNKKEQVYFVTAADGDTFLSNGYMLFPFAAADLERANEIRKEANDGNEISLKENFDVVKGVGGKEVAVTGEPRIIAKGTQHYEEMHSDSKKKKLVVFPVEGGHAVFDLAYVANIDLPGNTLTVNYRGKLPDGRGMYSLVATNEAGDFSGGVLGVASKDVTPEDYTQMLPAPPFKAKIGKTASEQAASEETKAAASFDRLPGKTVERYLQAAHQADFSPDEERRIIKELERLQNTADDAEIDRLPSQKGIAETEKKAFVPPKKTIKAYKLFKVKKTQPGKIFPLFIGNTKPTPVGEWIEAEYIPTKGYAQRPGWHAGILPTAPHLMKKDGTMPEDRVWAEVEMPADVNWQPIADVSKTKDIRDKIPAGGYYRFKTNKMQGGAWMVGGAIRVNRILTNEEVAGILEAAETDPKIDRLTSTFGGPRLRPATGTYRGSTERVKRASEIAKTMQAKLLLAVKKGGTGAGSLGTFNRRTWVIRIMKANDLAVLSHETGHGFDQMHGLSDPQTATSRGYNGPIIDTELHNLGQATSLPSYPNARIRREGVAEYVRLYLTDHAEALRRAPEFTRYFENTVPGQVRSIIQQISDDIKNLTDLDPVERVKKSIHFKGDPRQTESLDVLRLLRQLYTGVIDATYPVEWAAGQLTGKPGQAKIANMQAAFRGHEGIALNDVNPERDPNFKQVDLAGNEVGETLSVILAPVLKDETTRRDFVAYMVSRRAADYAARGFELPDDPRTYRAAVRQLEKKYPDFRQVFDDYLGFDRNNAHLLVEAGIYSPRHLRDIVDANPNHVSLRRIKEAFDYVAGTSKKLSGAKKVIKRVKGGGEDIQDPLENTINNVFIYRSVAMRNRILQQLADWADREQGKGWVMEKAPKKLQPVRVNLEKVKKALEDVGIDIQGINLDIMATIFNPNNLAGPNQVVVYRDGEPVIYDVHPDLYEAIAGMQPESANQIVQVAAALARMQKSGIVGAPQYLYRNLARDTFQNMIASRGGKGALDFIFGLNPFDILGGFFSTFRRDAWYRKAVQGGGAQNFFTSADRAYAQEALDKMVANRSRARLVVNKLRQMPRYFRANNYTEAFTALLDGISYAYGIIRDLVEPLELVGRMAEFKKTLVLMGNDPDAVEEAVRNMRDISIDFRRMGAWVKRLQMNRFINFFNSQLQGMDKFGRMFREAPFRTVLRSIVYITIPSLALLAVNSENPWYHELPWYRKDFFWNIPVGDPRSTKVFILVPKPWEVGLVFGSIPERLITAKLGKNPDAWADFKANMAQTFLPDIMPSALAPLYENAVNRDWRGIPIVSESDLRVSPPLQYSEHTSEVAKAVGGVLNLSPKQVEHVMLGYTGTLGRMSLGAADIALGKPEDSGSPRALLTSGFLVNATYSPQSVDNFYRMKQEADQLKADLKRQGKPIPGWVNGMTREFNRAGTEIKELRDRISDYRRRGLTRLADAATQQMIAKAQRVSRMYEKFRKEAQ